MDSEQGRPRTRILGILIDNLSLGDAVEKIEKWAEVKRLNPSEPGKRVVTANPEYIMLAQKDKNFKQVINSANMVTADGIGVILAGWLSGTAFRGRVTGVALAHLLAQRSAQTKLKIFLLGAAPGVAEEAAERFKEIYPGIRIVGSFAGIAGKEGDKESLKQIREAQPDLIFVAYGMLKQDYWALRNIEQSGAAVAIGVGGVLDYVSGRVPLAPILVRKYGLEWAYRLYQEPWRWRRMLALPRFVFLLGLEMVGRKLYPGRKV